MRYKQQQESKELSEEPSWYPAGKRKKFLDGYVYQLRLLKLYLYRGLKKDYSFHLATEMFTAGKFDDVVFRYREEKKKLKKTVKFYIKTKMIKVKNVIYVNNSLTKKDQNKNETPRYHRFLQAKHIDENKKITEKDLLADAKNNKPFSLRKYFNSYLDI